MKFSFTGNRKFAVKIGSYSQEYPLSVIDCFFPNPNPNFEPEYEDLKN